MSTDTPASDSPFSKSSALAAAAGLILFTALQAAGVYLRYFVFGDPIPFASGAEWRAFLLASTLLGAIVGAGLLIARRLPATSWLRAWVSACAAMLFVTVFINSERFAAMHLLAWLFMVLVTSVVGGIIFAPLYRWSSKLEASHAKQD